MSDGIIGITKQVSSLNKPFKKKSVLKQTKPFKKNSLFSKSSLNK